MYDAGIFDLLASKDLPLDITRILDIPDLDEYNRLIQSVIFPIKYFKEEKRDFAIEELKRILFEDEKCFISNKVKIFIHLYKFYNPSFNLTEYSNLLKKLEVEFIFNNSNYPNVKYDNNINFKEIDNKYI